MDPPCGVCRPDLVCFGSNASVIQFAYGSEATDLVEAKCHGQVVGM